MSQPSEKLLVNLRYFFLFIPVHTTITKNHIQKTQSTSICLREKQQIWFKYGPEQHQAFLE